MKHYILVDRSGSMESLWEEMMGAINTYVDKLEGNPKVYLAVFDNMHSQLDYEVLRECTKKRWKKIKPAEVEPRGGTPLNDALGKIIIKMLSDNEDKAVLIVATDGYENQSRKFTKETVSELLKTFKEKDWQTVFFGADFAGIKEQAKSYGVDSQNRGVLMTRGLIGETFNTLAVKTSAYATASVHEGAATMDWTPDEQAKARGN